MRLTLRPLGQNMIRVGILRRSKNKTRAPPCWYGPVQWSADIVFDDMCRQTNIRFAVNRQIVQILRR